jgi:hypothetical protein
MGISPSSTGLLREYAPWLWGRSQKSFFASLRADTPCIERWFQFRNPLSLRSRQAPFDFNDSSDSGNVVVEAAPSAGENAAIAIVAAQQAI